jgi:tetratricopeptide (TPR) repeat protein
MDLPRLQMLRGLVKLSKREFAAARDFFRRSLKAGQRDPFIYVYLAQAHFGLKGYNQTLDYLRRAGKQAQQAPSLFLIAARSHWALEQRRQAWDVLGDGRRAFPQNADLVRQQVRFLAELKLYHAAYQIGKRLLASGRNKAENFLEIADILKQYGGTGQAIKILEWGQLRYPNTLSLLTQLALLYNQQQKPLVAAKLLERAARADPRYFREAAALYLKAGRYSRALILNAAVVDQREKLMQRLAILIKLKRFEKVVALTSGLSRHGLLKQEDIRYAIAFAYYKVGHFDTANTHLSHLNSPDLIKKAAELRRQMATCATSAWSCL